MNRSISPFSLSRFSESEREREGACRREKNAFLDLGSVLACGCFSRGAVVQDIDQLSVAARSTSRSHTGRRRRRMRSLLGVYNFILFNKTSHSGSITSIIIQCQQNSSVVSTIENLVVVWCPSSFGVIRGSICVCCVGRLK